MTSPILWLSDSPGFGGSEVNFLRVLEMTADEPGVLALPGTLTAEFRAALKKIDRPRETLDTGAGVTSFPGSLWSTRALLNRYPDSPAIVWSHYTDSNRWAQMWMGLTRRPFAVVEQYIPSGKVELASGKTSIPLKRWVSGGASAIVLNAHSQRDHYRRLFGIGGSNVRVIPNSRPITAIAERVSHLRSDRLALRQSLSLPAESWVVICVARLTAIKDQSTLLRAWSLISDPSARLVLVGDGPDRPALQINADHRVTFAGQLDDPLPWLAAADAFVLPSRAEGLPGALIEAMAAGLPCIATDIPGNRELIRDDETGLAVPVGSHTKLAEAITRLRTDRESASRFALSGHALVSRDYDESTERKAWLNLVSDLRRSR